MADSIATFVPDSTPPLLPLRRLHGRGVSYQRRPSLIYGGRNLAVIARGLAEYGWGRSYPATPATVRSLVTALEAESTRLVTNLRQWATEMAAELPDVACATSELNDHEVDA